MFPFDGDWPKQKSTQVRRLRVQLARNKKLTKIDTDPTSGSARAVLSSSGRRIGLYIILCSCNYVYVKLNNDLFEKKEYNFFSL